MKIKILIILYLVFNSLLLGKESMTHTFKTHNFRIELPTYWELKKSFSEHKTKPILIAVSPEDRIQLNIFVSPLREKNLKKGFVEALKHHQLWAENYTELEQEAEFPLYNLEGYWAKTTGYKQRKKISGYVIYATDGVNIFFIHSFTNSSFFPKNFKTMRDIFNGFSLNRNFKNECCNECNVLSQNQAGSSKQSCSDFTETDECLVYFQNRPQTVNQCK